ncbi:MAG: DUF2950 family protein, partial [Planctomycetota bacterium]
RVTANPSTTATAGFTLIELLVVTAVLAVIAAIAVPFVVSARITANEAAAISTLKTIGTAQLEVRSGNWIDSDFNGVGEYGFLQELSGVRNTRVDSDGDGVVDSEGTSTLSPPMLASSFGALDSRGQHRRSGYIFRLYLPRSNLRWEGERATNTRYRRISTVHAESYWAVYAWPQSYGGTGKRAFFVNQTGQILYCTNDGTRYGGNRRPDSSAVIVPGSRNRGMAGPVAVNAEGSDRDIWKVVR